MGKKEDFPFNESSKKSLINMITLQLRQKNCNGIQAKGAADVEVVKGVVVMSSKKSTTLIGEDTDLLILLLYHGEIDSKELFFRSDKGNSHVYNIKTLKAFLGNDICTGLFFAHALTGCNTTSKIFSVGKKLCFKKSSAVVSSYEVVPKCSVLHAMIKSL